MPMIKNLFLTVPILCLVSLFGAAQARPYPGPDLPQLYQHYLDVVNNIPAFDHHAHPGFADLQGFGRRVINLTIKELEANIAYQIGALQAIAALHGAKVTHMKPHGMMANMSAESAEMSEAICRATKAVDRDLIFLAQANTEQGKAARKAGLRVAEEVFADRTYTDAGFLTPRKEANSMIKDAAQAVAHVRRMVDEQAIYSTSGKRIPCQVDSICVHGDGPTAVTVSKAVREGLEAAGIRIVPLPEMPNLKH